MATGLVLIYDGHLIHFLYDVGLSLPVLKMIPSVVQQYFALCGQIKSFHTGTTLPMSFYAQAFCAYTSCTPRVHFDPSLDPAPSDNTDNIESPEFQDATSLLAAQQDLYCTHHHFGHVSFHDIQQWAWDSKYDLLKPLSHCHALLCLACQYGQACKKPHPSVTGGLSEQANSPGAFVSINHMVSSTGGHIPFHVGQPLLQ